MVFQQPAAICANRFLKYAGKCLWEELRVWLCLQTSGLVTRPVGKVRQASAAWGERQQSERTGTEPGVRRNADSLEVVDEERWQHRRTGKF